MTEKLIKMKKISYYLLLSFLTFSYTVNAQSITIGDNNGKLTFEEYEPKSTLVVPEHPLKRAKFPFVDVHNHQFEMSSKEKVAGLVKEMDGLNMGVLVNLSGRGFGGDEATSDATLYGQIQNTQKNFPNRFVIFTNVDFSKISEAGWSAKAVAKLTDDVKKSWSKRLESV